MKIALVGASNNPEKYGNKILKDLIDKGYEVFPINPKEEKIENLDSYRSIQDIKDEFDILNFVVPPKITLSILKDNLELIKGKKIWCQPGSANQEVKDFLKENNFKDFIVDSCIMLENILEK